LGFRSGDEVLGVGEAVGIEVELELGEESIEEEERDTEFRRSENQRRLFLSRTIQWKSMRRWSAYGDGTVSSSLCLSFSASGLEFEVEPDSDRPLDRDRSSSRVCRSVRIPENGVTPMPAPNTMLYSKS
jgi:hypothetical protein